MIFGKGDDYDVEYLAWEKKVRKMQERINELEARISHAEADAEQAVGTLQNEQEIGRTRIAELEDWQRRAIETHGDKVVCVHFEECDVCRKWRELLKEAGR